MIDKYAEIQDRILLYNACKGILRVKMAKDASQMTPEDWGNEYDRLQNLVHNGDMERIRLSREQQALQAQVDDQASKLKGYEGDISNLNNQLAAKDKVLRSSLSQSAALANKANVLKNKATMNGNIANDNYAVAKNLSDMGNKLTSYGGAGIGAGVGGAAGYGLANWAGKKMGLTGNKALALNIAGTAAGAGLGGYGGYRLGQYAGDKMFDTSGASMVSGV